MLVFASDWTTISSLATGAGTLVLAIATFASVRSANRSARLAEVALQEQRRPMLAPSRLEDPRQKLNFSEGRWFSVTGGHAIAEHIDGCVYLMISLRNVGSGIGVCQGWNVRPGMIMGGNGPQLEFRRQSRDLYVPAGDIGLWQGALRDPNDPVRAQIADAIDADEPICLELLYSDQLGRQRTITRFLMTRVEDSRITSMSRHWYLDWEGPRPEGDARSYAAPVLIDQRSEPLPAPEPAEPAN